jgi:hypothetical protein
MTIVRGFAVVLASTIMGALAGVGIGYWLGVAMPSYYRCVFPNGNSPEFDPVQVGVGLGFTQGTIAGLVVGCVVVLAVAWYNSRRQVIVQGWAPDEPEQPPGGRGAGPSGAFRPAARPSAG